jgi:hypothetical protein
MIREENTENDKARMSADLFRDRSPATVALDNLMRRKLRVSDPTNANEIAAALGKLWPRRSHLRMPSWNRPRAMLNAI